MPTATMLRVLRRAAAWRSGIATQWAQTFGLAGKTIGALLEFLQRPLGGVEFLPQPLHPFELPLTRRFQRRLDRFCHSGRQ